MPRTAFGPSVLIRLSKSNSSGPRQEGGSIQRRDQADRLQELVQAVVGVDFFWELDSGGRMLEKRWTPKTSDLIAAG